MRLSSIGMAVHASAFALLFGTVRMRFPHTRLVAGTAGSVVRRAAHGLVGIVAAVSVGLSAPRTTAAPSSKLAPVLTTDRVLAAIPDEDQIKEAYAKLPLPFVPNRGQMADRVRYFSRGAGFSFKFTGEEVVLSFTREKRGHTVVLRFLGANPNVRLGSEQGLPGTVNDFFGNDSTKWRTNIPTYGTLVYSDLWTGVDLRLRGDGATLKYEFLVRPGVDPSVIRLVYLGATELRLGPQGELLIGTSLGPLRDAPPASYQEIAGRRIPVQSRYVLEGDNRYGFALGSYDSAEPLVIDPGLAYSTLLGGSDDDEATRIAVDGSGNAYVTGSTASADYPTTPGAHDMDVNGVDAFVTMLNAAGTTLSYSTFLGGSGMDVGVDIALDGSGNAFITGRTDSVDYPTTANAYDTSHGGNDDAFVTKLNASGSALLYSTFVGATGVDMGLGVAVDAGGNAYVTGRTHAASAFLENDFPTTPGAYDTSFNGGIDAFVTKLNAAGSALSYSTLLGGSGVEEAFGIAVDGDGNAYVVGLTGPAFGGPADYPTTPDAYDRTFNGVSDAFVTKLNASGSALLYSTFLGGTESEWALDVAVDGVQNAYVTGVTASADYPTTPDAYDQTFNGVNDAFVAKLNATGSALSYSTVLGGTGSDWAFNIAVDGSGNVYIAGHTDSADYPTTLDAYDETFNGGDDAFVTKLNAAGSALSYSTLLGGSGGDRGLGIAIDGGRNAYVAGGTSSADYPTTSGAYDTTLGGSSDAFVAKLETVATPEELGDVIADFELPSGTANSLVAKVNAAAQSLAQGNLTAACHQLNALIIEAQAQSGKKLTPDEAQAIAEAAEAVRRALGCP